MKLRRTMLYVPGNNPGMLKDAYIYGADSIMFDLEDSVPLREKEAARFLVFNALMMPGYATSEKVVRINGLDTAFGREDVMAAVAGGADVIRLPKAETAADIEEVEKLVEMAERRFGTAVGSTRLMAAIENAEGILNARQIARASERLIAIAIGAEDFVTDLHTNRSPEGSEIFVARSLLVMAARAAGIMALDTVYSDINDRPGFEKEVRMAKQLGFDGKSVIHPSQIPIVNSLYTPLPAEIEKAFRVVAALREAEKRGSGAVSVNGKMVDKPVVERALRNLELARAAGIELTEGAEL